MVQKTDELGDIARRLFEYESGGSRTTPGLADATDRCCLKMYQQLSKLMGPTGGRILVERALRLAREKHPFLNAVEVQPNGSLNGLRGSVEGQSTTDVNEGLVQLIDNVISLLSAFIGPDMVLAQVNAVWPQLSVREARQASQEGKR